jgi:hypothetical protein
MLNYINGLIVQKVATVAAKLVLQLNFGKVFV